MTIGFWPGLDLILRLSVFGQDLTSQFVPCPSEWQLTAFGQVLTSQLPTHGIPKRLLARTAFGQDGSCRLSCGNSQLLARF